MLGASCEKQSKFGKHALLSISALDGAYFDLLYAAVRHSLRQQTVEWKFVALEFSLTVVLDISLLPGLNIGQIAGWVV